MTDPTELVKLLRKSASNRAWRTQNPTMLTAAADHIDSLKAELLRLRDTCAEADVESIDRVLKGDQ